MSSIAQSSGSLESGPGGFTVEALAAVLPQAWLREAIVQCGRVSERVRDLPADLTLWLVVLLGLYRRHSYVNLLGMLFDAGRNRGLWATKGAPPSSTAFTKARDRLGVEPVRILFEASARAWTSAREGQRFYGRRVFAMDGMTLRIPDTAENHHFFGRPGVSRGCASHPQLRMVTLRDVGTRLCRAVCFGPYRNGELQLAQAPLQELQSGDLLLIDRNFVSYALLWGIHQRGIAFVVRGKHNLVLELVKEVAPGDAIVRVRPRVKQRSGHPELPREWLLRRVIYRPPGGDEDIMLLTTLLATEEIPAAAISAIYPLRWTEETGYDELKTHLCSTTTVTQPTMLRSMTPTRIEQELYGVLLAYNAMRATIDNAALRAKVEHPAPAQRLSFVHALERVREAVRDMMQIATQRLAERYENLLDAIARVVVPLRPGRSYPRAVKRKMSSYPVKPPPAHALRA